jgi:Ca2+-binding EF-hand superfamily protein
MKAVMTIFSMIDEDENGVIDKSEMHSLAVSA